MSTESVGLVDHCGVGTANTSGGLAAGVTSHETGGDLRKQFWFFQIVGTRESLLGKRPAAGFASEPGNGSAVALPAVHAEPDCPKSVEDMGWAGSPRAERRFETAWRNPFYSCSRPIHGAAMSQKDANFQIRKLL